MSKIIFAGDPHGDFKAIKAAAKRERPGAFILLGDYDLERPLDDELQDIIQADIPIWWIHGNHDADRETWHDFLFSSALAANNLHGRVADISGLRVAGLGGVFREEIWHPDLNNGQPRFRTPSDYTDQVHRTAPQSPQYAVRDGLPLKHRASIFWDSYEALWDQKADILVLHEAPESYKHGFRVLGELAEAMQVKLVVHGHHHIAYTGQTAGGIPVIGVDRAETMGLPDWI